MLPKGVPTKLVVSMPTKLVVSMDRKLVISSAPFLVVLLKAFLLCWFSVMFPYQFVDFSVIQCKVLSDST